jgi:hypothetical protein
MPQSDQLIAWIEPRTSNEYLAAFVSAPAAKARPPATQVCSSPDHARQWVEDEAAALGVSVQWVSGSPKS